MEKDNVFRSSEFFMNTGDTLHMLIIESSGTPPTLNLYSADAPTVPEGGTPEAPLATAATYTMESSFIANWEISTLADGYYLDVSTSSTFASYVVGYENLDVGDVLTYTVTGLGAATIYYFRVRGYSDTGTSDNSNSITLTTFTIVSDWFLPSLDELNKVYENIHLFGLGGFGTLEYWTSTESSATQAYSQFFTDGVQMIWAKSSFVIFNTRACRSFIAGIGAYSLRDTGPTGGLIFYVDGAGTTYYEVTPFDQGASRWSNITNIEIGVTAQGTAIGTGQANTNAVIGQAGHTESAAKLCDDLST